MKWAGGDGAADQQHPDVVRHRARLVEIAPAQIVQRVLDRLAHGLVDAIGHQPVQPRTFVDLVEMRQRLAVVQHTAAVAAADRRPVGVVQRAFDQVAGRQQILESLLVLDADRVAAEIVGDAQRGDVHLALQQDLLVGQVFPAGSGPVSKLHAALVHPVADGGRLVVGGLHGFVIQGRLAEPFLEHAGRVQAVRRE